MSIVSSTFASGVPQRDGRAWIDEKHVDHLSRVYEILYLGLLNAAATRLSERAVLLATQAIDAEIAANLLLISTLGSVAAVTLDYSTVAQNAAAIRAAYVDATQAQAVMMGDYLAARTNAQLQVAFGLTAAQVTTLRTNKLTPAATAAATVRATTGA